MNECDVCQASYIGSTVKQSKVRFYQHLGYSHKTLKHFESPPKSSIRDHCEKLDHKIKLSNFTILTSCPKPDVRILESLYIKKMKPNLNIAQSAIPLYFS